MSSSSVTGYCSWCFNHVEHYLVERNSITRNVYQCSCCRNNTLVCRYCSDLAKGKLNEELQGRMKLVGLERFVQSWDNELCAVHDGTIANFHNLGLKLNDITEYKKIFEREKVNLARVGKFAGYGFAGIVSVAGIAASGGLAGPIASALGKLGLLGATASGTAISTLSGAALTSASLAAIGGSVAVGTMIISASGLALGGVMGGVIANKYHGEDSSFTIRELRERDTNVKTVFINGFTQQNEKDFSDWQINQAFYDPNHKMYGVNWASETNEALGFAFASGCGSAIAKKMLVEIARTGGKKAASKLNPLTVISSISDIVGNPWHTAMARAAQTGVLLAEAISRTEGQKFNLVGHSLGCRVIFYALDALSTKSEKYIGDVILLGGAVGRNDKKSWERVLKAVGGKLYNCHSKEDSVLSIIYVTANAGLSSPIGIKPIELEHEKLQNVNCDELVESHMTWKKHYEKILRKIYG